MFKMTKTHEQLIGMVSSASIYNKLCSSYSFISNPFGFKSLSKLIHLGSISAPSVLWFRVRYYVIFSSWYLNPLSRTDLCLFQIQLSLIQMLCFLLFFLELYFYSAITCNYIIFYIPLVTGWTRASPTL